MSFSMSTIQIFVSIPHIAQITFLCLLFSGNVKSKGEEDLFCSCEKKEIKCKGIHEDYDILKLHLSAVKQNCTAAKKLSISNCQVPALPHDMLNDANFTEIKIDDSFLPFLAVPIEIEKAFTGGNLLRKFSLESVLYPYNWNWSILNSCENLSELRITKSDMVYVGPTFNTLNLPHLEHLTIKTSRVRWIHDSAFTSLRSLAFLNLMNNRLTSFKRSLLPDPALKLAVINARNNILEYLDDDLFENMPQLTYVNLENNNLVTISEFKNKGFFITLSGNPLQCDCSIEWLQWATNMTDSYRLRCFDSGTSNLVRNVDWKSMDC